MNIRKAKNIIFVSSALRNGGRERRLLELLKELSRYGWRVSLIVIDESGVDDAFDLSAVNFSVVKIQRRTKGAMRKRSKNNCHPSK